MNPYLKRANELKYETIDARRKIHSYGGIGWDIKETADLVFDALKSYGLDPVRIRETGITATIGESGPTILLRADMDALPIVETADIPYACKNGTMHACGHDMHTAMLLTAAKMLNENKDKLKGRVKLMFQPAEEGDGGAEGMIAEGILENPKVNAAMTLHTLSGHPDSHTGIIRYVRGTDSAACNMLTIKVKGRSCHGAYPNRGVDAINIGAKIVTALHEMMAAEVPPPEYAVLTICEFHSGTASNVVPDTAVLKGTIRTFDPATRDFILKRVKEIAEGTAKVFRGEAEVETPLVCGMCINDLDMFDSLLPKIAEVVGEGNIQIGQPIAGSEDFGFVMEAVPSILMFIGTGSIGEGYEGQGHRADVRFNEDALPIGAAVYAAIAEEWLIKNS